MKVTIDRIDSTETGERIATLTFGDGASFNVPLVEVQRYRRDAREGMCFELAFVHLPDDEAEARARIDELLERLTG